jgi:soluble lytic murein transglycosylase
MHIIKRIGAWLAVLISVLGIASLVFAWQYAQTRPVYHASLIHQYADTYRLDPNLVIAVIKTESDFHTDAVSPMDARGLMQILPDTAEWIARELDEEDSYQIEDLFEPDTNIRYGTFYLRYLLDHFRNTDLAIAAYNGGMGNVTQWIDEDTITNEGENMHSIPIDETRDYVQKVNTNREMYERLYGNQLPEEDGKKPTFHAVAENYKFLFDWFFTAR